MCVYMYIHFLYFMYICMYIYMTSEDFYRFEAYFLNTILVVGRCLTLSSCFTVFTLHFTIQYSVHIKSFNNSGKVANI